MDKLKSFFQQKKSKVKFAMMGEGTKLSSTSSHHTSPAVPSDYSQARMAPSADSRVAGEAALARIAAKNNPRIPSASLTYNRLRSQIEAELKQQDSSNAVEATVSHELKEVHLDGARMLEISGIYFMCPLIGPETASWNGMKEKIGNFLEEQLFNQEPSMAAALMIHSLNKDQEKIQKCIEILTKYMENIIANPAEEKFCRIRLQNKALQEKIVAVRGGVEFLKAAGFEEMEAEGDSGKESFLVMPESRRIPAELKEKLDVLILAEPIVPVLDRGVKVFFPSANASRFGALPDEFYAISKDELKREQLLKQDEIEKMGMLRTKAMRERDAIRELRRYRFCLVRFRFPDQTLLQGTFWSSESPKELAEFVKEHVEPDWAPFALVCRSLHGSTLQVTEETTGTLAELGLCPAVLFTVTFNADLMEQCRKEQIPPPRLKSSTLELIQPL